MAGSMVQDQLFRFIFDKLAIRGELIYLDRTWQAVLERHSYPENVQAQLGEALAIIGILSATIKFKGSLILQIQGSGPLATLVTQASHDGKLRGLARWQGSVPAGPLTEIYGQGHIVMTVNNQQAERYQSIVALEGRRLTDALETYFMNSEQLKSRFWLFVDKARVAGLFLQELPASSKEPEDWERISLLAGTTTAAEILQLDAEDFLHRLFHEEELRLFSPSALTFECSCSRTKIHNTLIALGRDELYELLQTQAAVEVDCEFCNQHYSFARHEIDELFAQKEDPGVPRIFH
ncbi:MAG: Hsp33 family molecular chaperone HslO [Pseudomonadales bacterium]|nr:Hsp33 family molecular chaperone HslO [Pseudomonadales bacterium]